jgi:phosphoglycerate dehydrogenase-like enzyme
MSFPLPFAPRRVLIGANAFAALGAWLRERRPEIDVRGAPLAGITPQDLDWAEVYVGFRRPPTASLGSVQWVHCTGAGVDAWMSPVEISRAILLTRTPESFGPAIAEWALTRALCFRQQVLALQQAQAAHRWEGREIPMLAGTRVLCVGTGDVGTAVARTFHALGCHVTGVSRTGRARDAAFRAVYPASALPHLVGDADWIVLTLPNTPATHHLFNRAVMARCRGAVLLNAGRGAVVEEAALPDALEAGWLSGAALDVFEVEPLAATSPLWDNPRVMISPHSSGPTTTDGAGLGFLECLAELEAGRLPARWVVDRERGY